MKVNFAVFKILPAYLSGVFKNRVRMRDMFLKFHLNKVVLDIVNIKREYDILPISNVSVLHVEMGSNIDGRKCSSVDLFTLEGELCQGSLSCKSVLLCLL